VNLCTSHFNPELLYAMFDNPILLTQRPWTGIINRFNIKHYSFITLKLRMKGLICHIFYIIISFSINITLKVYTSLVRSQLLLLYSIVAALKARVLKHVINSPLLQCVYAFMYVYKLCDRILENSSKSHSLYLLQ